MIVYEHTYSNSGGYAIKEVEVRETEKQYRATQRHVYFIGARVTLDKCRMDIPFRNYSVYAMYSLDKSNKKLFDFVSSRMEAEISSSQQILERCKSDYSAFLERQKDTPA